MTDDLKLAAQKALEAADLSIKATHLINDLEYAVLARSQGLPDSAERLSDAKQAIRDALQHQEEREPETVAVPIEAYRWLMGCGNDAFMPDREGAFWWRGKFNELAGLDVRDYMGLSTPPLLQKEEGDGKDAARYRWLRELPNADALNVRFCGVDLDHVVDEAIAAGRASIEGAEK